MRRRPLGLLLAAGLVLAALGTLAPAGAAGAARAPARLLVYAQEWSLWPSRQTIAAGSVQVELWNRGQDAHDLRIRRISDRRMIGSAQAVATTQSLAIRSGAWHLSPGRYELYCSMPGHLALGMHTTLVVRG
jgi:plastocyanin